MKRHQLSIFVRDVRTNAGSELTFVRSPVMVGRQVRTGVRLDAPTVSRRHGEFRFGKDGLQYVDLGSTNGTYVDGSQIELDVATPIRDSSIIDVVPFQIIARVDLVSRRPRLAVSTLKTAENLTPRAPALVAEWSTDLAGSASMQRLFLEYGPVALYRRATLALEVLARAIRREAESTRTIASSHLHSFASTGELVAHLIDPAAGAQSLDELRDALIALLQSTPNISREGTS